jgi:hypothetical protein
LEAVEIIYLASGGSGLRTQVRWTRRRDLHAVNMHGLLNLQTNMEMYGRIVLGLITAMIWSDSIVVRQTRAQAPEPV